MMYDFSEYQNECNEMNQLQIDQFWANLRSNLYKQICVGKGGANQWAYITGKRFKDSKGNKIQLTEQNKEKLNNLVDYFSSSEGSDELFQIGISDSFNHYDDIIEIIRNAKSKTEIKKDEFRSFLKHKSKIISYLTRILS
jgi:hypothetical protein